MLSSSAQGRVLEMDVAVCRCGPARPEQAPRDMQALAVNDRVRSMHMAQVVQPGIRDDPQHVAHLDPEPPQVISTQRPVPLVARKHPLPGRRFGEMVQQLAGHLGEQNVPRSRLRAGQSEAIRLDLAPSQAANLARPALGQQEQAPPRDADRTIVLAVTQNRAEPRKVIFAEQPLARRSPVADDALARVLGGFGPMAPRDVAVEHVAQYLMTSIGAARPSASVFVEEAGNVSADHRADAELAERGQDGAVEIAQGRLHRGRLPRGRAPLDEFGGELRQRRAGGGRGHRSFAALLAREERERGDPRLVGLHRVRLAERDAAQRRLA